MRRSAWLRAFALTFSGSLIPTAASAAEGQWRAGLGIGLAAAPKLSLGASANAVVNYGLLESLDFTLNSSLSRFELDSERGTLLSIAPGVLYKIDVVRWVPHLGANVGFAKRWGAEEGAALALEGVVGVDYLWSRRWSFGAQYRATFVLDLGAEVPLSQLLARAGYHWGY